MLRKILYILLLTMSACGVSPESPAFVRYVCSEVCGVAEIDIMVLSFGQSNSLGIGSEKLLFNKRENVFFFDNEGWGNSHDYGRSGPETSLGESLGIKYPDKNIGVIKIAIGGTRVEEWLPSTGINNGLLDSIESAKMHGNIDHVTGYFWMQGESDSKDYMDSINYASTLSYFISSLRDDDAPFVIGLIGTRAFPYVDNVREAQVYVAFNAPRTYTVETNDLQKRGDAVHFSECGLRILGERFAEKFIEVQP